MAIDSVIEFVNSLPLGYILNLRMHWNLIHILAPVIITCRNIMASNNAETNYTIRINS